MLKKYEIKITRAGNSKLGVYAMESGALEGLEGGVSLPPLDTVGVLFSTVAVDAYTIEDAYAIVKDSKYYNEGDIMEQYVQEEDTLIDV